MGQVPCTPTQSAPTTFKQKTSGIPGSCPKGKIANVHFLYKDLKYTYTYMFYTYLQAFLTNTAYKAIPIKACLTERFF